MEIDEGMLVRENLTPDEYCLLFCKYEGRTTAFRYSVDVQDLEKRGWIKDAITGIDLRHKTIDLFKSLEYDYRKDKAIATSSIGSGMILEELVVKMRELFPPGAKLAGRPLMGSKKGCTKKMRTFQLQNPEYSDNTIIEATKAYLGDFYGRKSEWRYCVQADYFIDKDGVSKLQTYCEMIEDGSIKPIEQAIAEEGYSRDI